MPEAIAKAEKVKMYSFVPFLVLTVQVKVDEALQILEEEDSELKKQVLQTEIVRAQEKRVGFVPYNICFGEESNKPFIGQAPARFIDRLKKRAGYSTEFITQADMEELVEKSPKVFQQWTSTMQKKGRNAGLDDKEMDQLPIKMMTEIQKTKITEQLRGEVEAKVRAEMAKLKETKK